MLNNRSSGNLLFSFMIVSTFVGLLILSHGLAAASEYEESRTNYFMDRSVNYAKELLLKEEYLSILYQCTAAELKTLKGEKVNSDINSPFWNLEPANFDRDNPDFASMELTDRYRIWVEFEEREYQRRLRTILDIRAKLIENATAEQKNRMFKRELARALKYYGQADWELATQLFDRLLLDYNFIEVDDVLFYQSEANLQLKRAGASLGYLLTLLAQCPNSNFRSAAYDVASRTMLELGKYRDLLILYRNYSNEGFPGEPAKMGGFQLRAAQSEVAYDAFENAVEILERISSDSQYYLASRYFLSDCLAALEKWPQAVEVLNEMIDMKQRDMSFERRRILTDEARIKLAFIYYKWEEYDKADELFDKVKNNSPFFDRVLMGKAWIAFQLNSYEDVIQNTEELLQIYPQSSEIYEAGSLTGYCYEQIGEKSTALTHFYDVLNAGVGRSKLQTFTKERERITRALSELQSLEETVFTSGNEQFYLEYKRAYNLLALSLKRIGLAELLEANEGMRILVAERVLLDRMVNEHRQMETEIESSRVASMMSDFLTLEDRIYDLMDRLRKAGDQRLKSTPLYYHESRVEYINLLADSISTNLEAEIMHLIASIEANEGLYSDAYEKGLVEKCIDYGLNLDNLKDVLGKSYTNYTMSEESRRPVLQTRVERWSDFSFSRYAMGGMEFDELDKKYQRLDQVEDYILTLDDMRARVPTATDSGDNAIPAGDDALQNSEIQPE